MKFSSSVTGKLESRVVKCKEVIENIRLRGIEGVNECFIMGGDEGLVFSASVALMVTGWAADTGCVRNTV